MNIVKTKLDGVLLVKPDSFDDHRGTYTEIYNEEFYKKNGIGANFIRDSYSASSKYILRGFHGDDKTWKLIDCLYGRFYLVILNVLKDSPQYGEWESFTLSDTNHWQVLVPPNFANAHLALSDHIVFHYKMTEYYKPNDEFTIRYDDPRFKVWWPVKNPILSRRDDEV